MPLQKIEVRPLSGLFIFSKYFHYTRIKCVVEFVFYFIKNLDAQTLVIKEVNETYGFQIIVYFLKIQAKVGLVEVQFKVNVAFLRIGGRT